MHSVHIAVLGVKKGGRKEKTHIVEVGTFPVGEMPSNIDSQAIQQLMGEFKSVKHATLKLWAAELNEATGMLTVEVLGQNNVSRVIVG